MQSVSRSERARFVLPVRVYYEDTDAAGVVYYASYLRFLERARTEWLRALGFEQSRLARELGIGFAARSLKVDYLKSAQLDDQLNVVAEIESLGRAQLSFCQRVERGSEVLLTASMRVACIEVARMRPAAIPEEIRNRLEALV